MQLSSGIIQCIHMYVYVCCRPAELIYRFDLPRVSKASQIILDVFEK